MNSLLRQLFLLLTIFIMAEVFVLDGYVTHHDGLPIVTETEWVYEEPPLYYPQVFLERDAHSTIPPFKPLLERSIHFQLQPLFYQEKLQLTEGYQFVFLSSCKSNIPHLNRDDEDPASIWG